ncbi:MAG: hypothetical protein Q4D29_00920 [Lachnospiraceae bacterium]|nr:hypothetical protein [Lachnospiraceae bacterium]
MRKQIYAKENVDLLMQSEVSVRMDDVVITIHNENSTIESIIAWSTEENINQIKAYLKDNCPYVTFNNRNFLSEAKYFSKNEMNLKEIAVVTVKPSGNCLITIEPSVAAFMELIEQVSPSVYYAV